MRSALLLGLGLLLAACSGPASASDAGNTPDGGTGGGAAGGGTGGGGTGGGMDGGSAGMGGGATGGGGTGGGGTGGGGTGGGGTGGGGTGGGGAPDGGTYRTSLHVCWNDPACTRALALAHGGVWDTTSAPYDSNAALAQAYADDYDGVKIDVRVTSDNVPVIAHSSPLLYYESLDCSGLVIENSTAAQVTACHRFPSTTEKFQRLDDVLNDMRGKMVVQLCVKRSQDYQRTADEMHTLGAQDFSFIEVNASDMTTAVATMTNASDIFFLVNLASDTTQVTPLLQLGDPRAFMFEFDPTVDVSSITPNQLHPAGVRSFTYDSSALLSVSQAKTYFDNGYDVVSANAGDVAQQARVQVNQARGISPP